MFLKDSSRKILARALIARMVQEPFIGPEGGDILIRYP
jgi:hypothetical protein